MKNLSLTIGAVFVCASCFAQQISNYSSNGDQLKTFSEFTKLEVSVIPRNNIPAAGATIAGVVLGPVFNITAATIKNAIEKRQKSFVATYLCGYSGI
ncbi:MAG: hypothetical protein V4456_11130 [Bacteroidota bacterium]